MKKHDDQASPALREAIKMLKARKGPATDEDRPRRPAVCPHVLPGQLSIADALVLDDGRADEPNSSSPEPGKVVTAELQRDLVELLARRTTARGVNSSPAAVTTVARQVLCRGLEIAMEIADKALDGHPDYAHWREPL